MKSQAVRCVWNLLPGFSNTVFGAIGLLATVRPKWIGKLEGKYPPFFRWAGGCLFTIALAAGISGYEQQKADRAEMTRLVDMSTGGSAFPYITPEFFKDVIPLTIRNSGDFSLYDVSVELTNDDVLNELVKRYNSTSKGLIARQVTFPARVWYSIGNINPHREKDFAFITPKGKRELHYSFGISARNGGFSEKLHLIKTGNNWAFAWEVEGSKGLLKRDASPNFPTLLE